MRERIGDYFGQQFDAIVVPTCGYCTSKGRAWLDTGIGYEAMRRWPRIPGMLADKKQAHGMHTICLTDSDPHYPAKPILQKPAMADQPDISYHVISLPIKPSRFYVSSEGWERVRPHFRTDDPKTMWIPGYQAYSNLGILRHGAEELRDMATAYGWTQVGVPRLGTEDGGLSWPLVKKELSNILDDRFIVVLDLRIREEQYNQPYKTYDEWSGTDYNWSGWHAE